MSELRWNWVYYPYLDAPNKQEESALKAGYIKVVSKDEADKVIARYKYKHCLDMAYKCVDLCHKSKDLYRWADDENLEHYYNHKIEFFARWHKRWLELAEKFKEAK